MNFFFSKTFWANIHSFILGMIQDNLLTRRCLARLGKAQSPLYVWRPGRHSGSSPADLPSKQWSVLTPPVLPVKLLGHNQSRLFSWTWNVQSLRNCKFISTCLKLKWDEWTAGRRPRLVHCQAELKARLLILKHTRWKLYAKQQCPFVGRNS